MTNEEAMPADFDLEESTPVNETDLKALAAQAMVAETLINVAKDLESHLKEVKAELQRIQNEVLPDMMAELGMNNFSLDSGLSISIKPFISASIPATGSIQKAKTPEDRAELMERKRDCLMWLRLHGGKDIIKNQIEVEIPKGEHSDTDSDIIMEFLEDMRLSPVRVEGVHHQTLNAFIKEKIGQGANVPDKPFSLHMGETAKIKMPKEDK